MITESKRPRCFQLLENLGVSVKVRRRRFERHIVHHEVAVDYHQIGIGRRHKIFDERIRLVVAGASHNLVLFVHVHLRIGQHHDFYISVVGGIHRGISVLACACLDERHDFCSVGIVVASNQNRACRHQNDKRQKYCQNLFEISHNLPIRADIRSKPLFFNLVAHALNFQQETQHVSCGALQFGAF